MCPNRAAVQCILVFNFPLAISANPIPQYSRQPLQIGETLPSVKDKSVIYVIQFDPPYMDISHHSEEPLIVNGFSDRKYTIDRANLDLQGMHFNAKKLRTGRIRQKVSKDLLDAQDVRITRKRWESEPPALPRLSLQMDTSFCNRG